MNEIVRTACDAFLKAGTTVSVAIITGAVIISLAILGGKKQ